MLIEYKSTDEFISLVERYSLPLSVRDWFDLKEKGKIVLHDHGERYIITHNTITISTLLKYEAKW